MADVPLKTARGEHINQSEVKDLIADMAAKASGTRVDTLSARTDTLEGSVSANTASLADKIGTDQLGASNGVATLDSAGTIPLAQIPSGIGGGGGWEVGDSKATRKPRLPADGKWAYEDGSAISRSGHPDCFDALCPQFTGDTTTGSAVIANIDDMEGMQAGQEIEGAGIPTGAVIASLDTGASTITLDQNATANATGVSLRFSTYGFGDGSSTFNLPDAKGRVNAGRDNMGGSAANRLTNNNLGGNVSNPDGSKLGATGGSDRLAVGAQIASMDTSGVGVYSTLQGQTPLTSGNPNIGLKNLSNMPNTIVTNFIIKILP